MTATLDALKKAFLIGLGATVLTGEKIKELVDDLVARGELSHTDAKQFAEDLKDRAIKEKNHFDDRVKETVDNYLKKALDTLGLATKADIQALKDQLHQHHHE